MSMGGGVKGWPMELSNWHLQSHEKIGTVNSVQFHTPF